MFKWQSERLKMFTDILEEHGIEITDTDSWFLEWIARQDMDTAEALVSLLKKCIKT